MTDNQLDGASTPVASEPALKSTDTRKAPTVSLSTDSAAKESKPEPAKAKAAEPQDPTPDEGGTPPEGDHAPAAEKSERKEQRLPRWMKERLERERQVTAARTREQVLRELQEQQPIQREPEPQGERERTLEDFDFDPVAYQKYLAKQAVEDYKREELTRAQQREQAAAADKFKAKIDSFEAKVGAGSWEDIDSSPLNTDPDLKPLVDLFLGDEHDLEMAHHLATHPAEIYRLMALSPLQRVRELAKLADMFSGEVQAEPVTPVVPPKKTTNAPPPPKTVSGAGKPAVDIRNPNISTADRIKAWKANGR